jgi:hypothetical protein
MPHAARRPWSWLIFDVRQTMKRCAFPFLLSAAVAAADIRIARAGGAIIIFQQEGERRELALPESVGVDMTDAVLLAWGKSAGEHFLLLLVRGPSRRTRDSMGYCGAGVESAIVWLRLRNWVISDSKTRRVESCFHSVSLLQGPRWKEGICSLTFWDFPDGNQEFTLRYDSKTPSAGFTLTAKPFN